MRTVFCMTHLFPARGVSYFYKILTVEFSAMKRRRNIGAVRTELHSPNKHKCGPSILSRNEINSVIFVVTP